MARYISDEEFLLAWNNKTFRKILSYYGSQDTQDQRISLWLSLRNFNGAKNCKFTTYLAKVSRWYKIKLFHKNKQKTKSLAFEPLYSNKNTFYEIEDILSTDELSLIKSKFILNMTLEEIAKEKSVSVSSVCKKIKSTLIKIKYKLSYLE